jgi:hypothetical protein
MKHAGLSLGFAVVLAFGAAFMASCASPEEARQVKLYQDRLAPFLGKPSLEVTKAIAYDWKFGVLDKWDAVDPGPEAALAKNFKVGGFSKQEAARIFAKKGSYKALVFQKIIGEGGADVEVQVSMGMTGGRQHSADYEMCRIRVVFRDDKLVDFKVW